MDGEEKVRILAWRQENVIMEKSVDVLRRKGHLWWPCWLLHVTYSKMSFLLPSHDLDEHQKPPNTSKHTDDIRRHELHRKPHLSASELNETHQDHLGNVSIRFIEHHPQKGLKIPSRRVASKTILTTVSNLLEISSRNYWWQDKVHVVWWIHILMHLQYRI